MRKVIVYLIPLLLIMQSPVTSEISDKGADMSSDPTNAVYLLNKADDTFQSREYEKALENYKAAYEKAREEFNRSVEVESLAQIARMNLILGNKEMGREFLKQVEERVEKEDSMGFSRYLSVKGRFEWKDNDLEAARNTFREMFEYTQEKSLYGRKVDAANMMAIVSEDPQAQIEWSRKGIEAAEESENESLLGALWNNLGCTYYDMKDFNSALDCYKKSREFHWRFSGEVAKLYADYHIGMTYRLLGDCDNANKWLRPVLAWAERLQEHGAIGQACEDIGECSILSGDKRTGLDYLKRARDEYQQAGYDQSWQEIWDNINKRISEVEG